MKDYIWLIFLVLSVQLLGQTTPNRNAQYQSSLGDPDFIIKGTPNHGDFLQYNDKIRAWEPTTIGKIMESSPVIHAGGNASYQGVSFAYNCTIDISNPMELVIALKGHRMSANSTAISIANLGRRLDYPNLTHHEGIVHNDVEFYARIDRGVIYITCNKGEVLPFSFTILHIK